MSAKPRRFLAGAVPPFLIVPIKEGTSQSNQIDEAQYLWKDCNMPAFDTWEAAAAFSRKEWRKKTRFLILNGPALIDDRVPIYGENGAYTIEGDVHRRYALNLNQQTRRQISAGGVVRCMGKDGPMHALIQVKRKGTLRWEVPKGKIKRHERLRDAAIREVREETGLQSPVHALEALGRVDYLFLADDRHLYFKSVHYYLLETENADPLTPRAEEGITDARWFPVENAWEIVSFPNLRPILRRAADRGDLTK